MRRNPSSDTAVGVYLDRLPANRRRAAARLIDLYVTASVSTPNKVDWGAVSPATLVNARSQLARSYSPSTVNSVLSCVKGVLREGLRMGLVSPQQYLDSNEVPGMDRNKPTSPLELSSDSLAALFTACANDHTPTGRRDAFLLLMIACGGFSRREVAQFRDLQAPRLIAPGFYLADMRHHGGSFSLLLQARARETVAAWIDIRGAVPGAAVCKISGRGEVLAGAPNEQIAYRIIARRAEEAGIRTISTAALKWYYRLHPPTEVFEEGLLPRNAHPVLEPPLAFRSVSPGKIGLRS